jgi:16S rRNA (uracil1498-N3)-methyltransferase
MQIFYAPGINGDIHYLDENESRHCIRVLRMTEGSRLILVDGKGNLFEGYISNPDQKRCQISITGIVRDFEKRDYRLHIAVSPLKNQDRFEWFVEKSVETGIDEITPIYCKNTEKQGIKTERINNIIISAMKQSIKTVKTEFHRPVNFIDFIKSDFAGVRMIAHCSNKTERTGISSVYTRGNDATILIGPEGDFSEEEIKMAVRQGFKSVHLGNSRFRTETAGVAACLAVYFINQ